MLSEHTDRFLRKMVFHGRKRELNWVVVREVWRKKFSTRISLLKPRGENCQHTLEKSNYRLIVLQLAQV